MKEKGLIKAPGCSWTQIREDPYVFFPGDRFT